MKRVSNDRQYVSETLNPWLFGEWQVKVRLGVMCSNTVLVAMLTNVSVLHQGLWFTFYGLGFTKSLP